MSDTPIPITPSSPAQTTPPNPPRLTVRANGSILVEGIVEMIGPNGAPMVVKEKFSLCRCGHSQNKPFCDGSHKAQCFDSTPC